MVGLRVVPILAGGGTRLPVHVGVLKALEDLGVVTEHIVGVSGGASSRICGPPAGRRTR
nr:patatin-like phospholipase family protein [Thiorhodococcus mannitoliphagus]